ncbi:MAG: hypothetical protein GX639_07835 [Fibrobacter sp.]|nr:hypothetical protein [Fibrobacter sp.]
MENEDEDGNALGGFLIALLYDGSKKITEIYTLFKADTKEKKMMIKRRLESKPEFFQEISRGVWVLTKACADIYEEYKELESAIKAEYPLAEPASCLPAFLSELPSYPEVITSLPEPGIEGRVRRAYISRITFHPFNLASEYVDFDTLTEFFLMDKLNASRRVWTCHKSVRPGDLFFMVLADSANKALRDMAYECREKGCRFSEPWKQLQMWVEGHRKKLFAWSYFTSHPRDMGDDYGRWRYQAEFGPVQFLRDPLDIVHLDYEKNPVARDEIVGGTGTDMSPHRYLSAASYRLLRDAIIKKNPNQCLSHTDVETFGVNCDISSENWLSKIQSYDDFWAECHVREIFTDELMKRLSDNNAFIAEAQAFRNGDATGKFADYVILVGGQWLPVEVKYNAKAVEKHLVHQVTQYINCQYIHPETGETIDVPHQNILVVDRDAMWLWKDGCPSKQPVLLRKEISAEYLMKVRRHIIEMTSSI